MREESMNTDNDEMRTEYRHDDLGKGVRGKYAARYAKGTNLVLLDDKVAKPFRQRRQSIARYWRCSP